MCYKKWLETVIEVMGTLLSQKPLPSDMKGTGFRVLSSSTLELMLLAAHSTQSWFPSSHVVHDQHADADAWYTILF